MKLDVHGIVPPMVTPFTWDTEELDIPAIENETEYYIQSGIHGLCVGGSTGEGAGLPADEVYTLCKTVVEQTKDRVPVIGGIIADSASEAIRKGIAAKEAGVAALQVTPPHYLYAPSTQGLVRYYQTIGEACRLPILIYNVIPWVSIDVQAMKKIAQVEWVAGIKQSGGDMHKVADMIAEFKDRLTVITAVDDLLYPSFCLGVDGAISCLLAVLPEMAVELWNKVQSEDHTGAREIHDKLLPVWRSIEGPNMTYQAKVAIEMLGRRVGPSRNPIDPPDSVARDVIQRQLVQIGVL